MVLAENPEPAKARIEVFNEQRLRLEKAVPFKTKKDFIRELNFPVFNRDGVSSVSY